jgi:hypothetical protein
MHDAYFVHLEVLDFIALIMIDEEYTPHYVVPHSFLLMLMLLPISILNTNILFSTSFPVTLRICLLQGERPSCAPI